MHGFILFFSPLGIIHHQQNYSLPSYYYSHLEKEEKQTTLLIKLTETLKPNDFQYRFYGKVIRLGQKKSEGKILVGIIRDNLKQVPNTGDLILTPMLPQPILSQTNTGGFDFKKYLSQIKIHAQL